MDETDGICLTESLYQWSGPAARESRKKSKANCRVYSSFLFSAILDNLKWRPRERFGDVCNSAVKVAFNLYVSAKWIFAPLDKCMGLPRGIRGLAKRMQHVWCNTWTQASGTMQNLLRNRRLYCQFANLPKKCLETDRQFHLPLCPFSFFLKIACISAFVIERFKTLFVRHTCHTVAWKLTRQRAKQIQIIAIDSAWYRHPENQLSGHARIQQLARPLNGLGKETGDISDYFEHGSQTNATLLFTPENKRNVGRCWRRCLMQHLMVAKRVQHVSRWNWIYENYGRNPDRKQT